MASLSVTNTFVAGTTATAASVNQNFSDVVNYINNRNAGSASWDACSIAGNLSATGTVSFSRLISTGSSGNAGRVACLASNASDAGVVGFVINQFQISSTNADGVVLTGNSTLGSIATPTYGGGGRGLSYTKCVSRPLYEP